MDGNPLFSLWGVLALAKIRCYWKIFRRRLKGIQSKPMTTTMLDEESTAFEAHAHDRLEEEVYSGQILRAWGLRRSAGRKGSEVS